MSKNFKDRIYIATVCEQHREIMKEFQVGVELDQFCSAANMTGKERRDADLEIKSLLTHLRDREKIILHAPFNELFPAAIDPKARKLAMERFNEAVTIAVEYGAKKMVVHSGYVPLVYFKDWHIERSVEFWHEFIEGKPENFCIAIENVLEDEPYMMVRMMEKIKDKRIGLCLDVGHANCVSDLPSDEWLEVMAPYLKHIHIHNNDGEWDYHRPLWDGNIDIEKFLKDVVELCREDTTVTIESIDGKGSLEWLEEKGFL